jgi:hypothetical protein
MKYKSMFPWMILDMAVFVALNIFLIKHFSLNFEILQLISPFSFLVFGLAVYRAANIVSNEFITTPIRAYFVDDEGYPREEGFRGFAGSLLYCPACTGVWIAAILTYSYLIWSGPTSVIILLLALSGMERFFAYTFGRIKVKK